LGPDDPAPFELTNAGRASPFLLIGDPVGAWQSQARLCRSDARHRAGYRL